MRRLILVLATIGVAVLLASGAALAITGGWADDGECQTQPTPEPQPCGGGIIKYPEVGALVDEGGCTARVPSSRPPSF